MKTLLRNLSLLAIITLFLAGCRYKIVDTQAETAATQAPTAQAESTVEPTTPPDTIIGDWQGEPLTEGVLKTKMAEAGWNGAVDYVTEDVKDYGHVSRLIFAGNPEEQAHALEVANTVAQKFNGVLWYMYGAVGSGKECGWRTPQTGLHLLRIEVYSTGAFLPEETSCRPAP